MRRSTVLSLPLKLVFPGQAGLVVSEWKWNLIVGFVKGEGGYAPFWVKPPT
jgi:hypothetical protein